MSEEQVDTTEVTPEAAGTPPAAAPEAEAKPGEGAQLIARLAEADRRAREAADKAKSSTQKLTQYEQLLKLAQSDPARFQAVMGGQAQPAAAPARTDDGAMAKLSELERKIAERERVETERTRHAQLQEAEKQVVGYVQGKREEFPFVTAFGLEGAVYDRLLEYHQAGQTISEQQAAREVEASLAGKLEALAQIPAVQDAVSKLKGGTSQRERKSTTLSNDLTGTVSRRSEPDDDEDFDSALRRATEVFSQTLRG